MTANREVFQQLYELLSTSPELHHQGSWEGDRSTSGTDTFRTTRDIAGWAVVIKARELGLLPEGWDQQRDDIPGEVLLELGSALGVPLAPESGWDERFEKLAAAIFGLTRASTLFLLYDMDEAQVRARVKSYADTGYDLPGMKIDTWR